LSKYCEELNNRPFISYFNSNKSRILKKNEAVDFTWEAKKYDAIYLNDILIPVHKTNFQLPIENSKEIKLRVINSFGSTEETIKIEAQKVQPEILEFKTSTLERKTKDPVILSWKVKKAAYVKISSIEKKLESEGSLEVHPEVRTTYSLSAFGEFDECVEEYIIVDIAKPKISYFDWEVNINEGIDNIDLSWKTKDAIRVRIYPIVGDVNESGKRHVKVKEKTEFTLIAENEFTKTEKIVMVHPFPVPIIKHIFADTPSFELNVNLQFDNLKVPSEFIALDKIELSKPSELMADYNQLPLVNGRLDLPEYEFSNALLDRYSRKKISLMDIYEKIKYEIYKRLK
jgi:hypothetical protein